MDTDLLNKLYRKYYEEIFLYLYSLSGDYHLAEDLIQETFLKALLSLPNGHTNMRAWLYMVGRNLYYNYFKREKHRTPYEDLTQMPDEKEELLAKIIEGEDKRFLYEALSHLEGHKREVMLMQYFGGLSQREIAAVLHLTPENVRVLAYRAKQELRKYLEVHGYDIS